MSAVLGWPYMLRAAVALMIQALLEPHHGVRATGVRRVLCQAYGDVCTSARNARIHGAEPVVTVGLQLRLVRPVVRHLGHASLQP